jgi:anti-anti-sigma factor
VTKYLETTALALFTCEGEERCAFALPRRSGPVTTGSRSEQILLAPERLDLETCDTFRRAAGELMDLLREGRGRLVVDMRATQHLDSAGLRALVMVRRRAVPGGNVIRLRGPTEEIRAILVLTKTDGLFEIEEADPA